MTPGGVATAFVAIAVLMFVFAPLLTAPRRRASDAASLDNLNEARELQSRQDMLLASIKDLEDDRATDKIGEDDYRRLHERLSAEAIEVLQRLDVLERERDEAERAASRPLRHPASRS